MYTYGQIQKQPYARPDDPRVVANLQEQDLRIALLGGRKSLRDLMMR